MTDAALRVLPPGHDRRRFIGGSDAAAVVHLGATYDGVQQTPYTVWVKKTAAEPEGPPDPEREKFFRRRKRWEGPIVEMLREEFDAEIVAVNQRFVDPDLPFLAAEIDFEWRDADGSIQNGEIKTVSSFVFGERHGWGEAGTANIPIHYAAQVMHGLGVTRRRVCIVAAMVGFDSMVFYRVERDDETIAAMREECTKFWNHHVLAGAPPDPQTMHDLRHLMLRRSGRPVELDETLLAKLHRLRRVREEAKALADEDEQLSFALGDHVLKAWGLPDAGGAENAILTYGGEKVATWAKQDGASLDQKRLRAEKPEIIADYTRRYTFRVLRISKPK